MERSRLAVTLAICATTVMGGCPQLLNLFESYNGDLDAAMAKAESAAQNWDANSKLTAIIGAWVTEDGAVLNSDESTDNPLWGFSFLGGDGQTAFGITVQPDGTTTTPVEETPTSLTSTPIGQYTADDMEALMDTAIAEYADHPAPFATIDVVIMVGYSAKYQQEQAIIALYEEDDQATDFNAANWFATLLAGADEIIRLDPMTGDAIFRSWDNVTLDDALKIAEAQADAWDPQNKITSIIGSWVHPEGAHLNGDEVEDNPIWGFGFTDEAGTMSYGLTISTSGAMTTPVEEALTPFTTVPIRNYNATDLEALMDVAIAEYETEFPSDAAYDVIIMVGYSPTYEQEQAIIAFYEEADQATDYAEADWFMTLIGRADEIIRLDPITGDVIATTW